jgi:thioredoxin 1
LLTRVLWALAIVAAGLVLYRLVNWLVLCRAQRTRDAGQAPLPGARPGVPAVLYFTTPDCAPCKTVQRPALEHLQERLGDRLQIIEVDAQARPDLARCWGVLSVPTTFVIDELGRLRHVNHGATRAEKLIQQLEG